MTTNLNIHLEDLVSTKINHRELQHPWKEHPCNIHERTAIAITLITAISTKMAKIYDHKIWTVGAPRWTSALTRQITWPEYYQTTVDNIGEKTEKLIPSSNIYEASKRCFDRQHWTEVYSEGELIYSKQVGSCIKVKWW